jgi:hypothetical protein
MWPGIDPELRKQLEHIRELVRLSHQSPTKEWPLVFVKEFDALLVVREWPSGHITAYAAPRRSGETRKDA